MRYLRRTQTNARTGEHGAVRAAVIWLLCSLALGACGNGAASHMPTPLPSPTSQFTPCQRAFEAPNPIASENTCPGTSAWRENLPLGAPDAIEGYVSSASVAAGDHLDLFVSTTAASYTFAIYRMGYYQGLGARQMYQSPSIPGVQQPAPTVDSVTRTVECAWTHPTPIHIARYWVSGVYLIKLVSSDGNMRYTFFVVRNVTVRTPILYVAPFLTYQAYNLWGGFSLYRGTKSDGVTLDPTLRSYAVSFDRPYMYNGLSTLGLYDLPLLFWMESQSYNMTYIADFDLDAPTVAINTYKLTVFSGHMEYWSTRMRVTATSARDAGVSLAFFGANDIYWHVRLAASPLGSDRMVVCYKSAQLDPLTAYQPQEATVRWRDAPLSLPEQSLLGAAYGGGITGFATLTLATGSAPFLSGSSLSAGSGLPDLIGGEYDRVYPNDEPAHVQIIATSTLTCIPTSLCPASGIDTANATIYTAPSGSLVFDAGTFQWSWGLSDGSVEGAVQGETAVVVIHPGSYASPPFQRVTANILTSLLR